MIQMIAAHRGIVPAPFDHPSGIVELPVCTEGGLLPSAGCPATRLERFIAGTQPTRPDDTHVVIRVDPERNCRAPNGDSAARGVPQRFWLLPPEAAPWAASAGVPQPPTQVCAVAGGAASAQAPGDPAPALDLGVSLAITSPAPGTVYTISPGVPREHQRIELRALAGADTISLIIQLDGAPVATLDRPPYRTLWQLTPGKHYVSVVARDSRGQIQSSSAVGFDVQQ